jgi:hypothetical protein
LQRNHQRGSRFVKDYAVNLPKIQDQWETDRHDSDEPDAREIARYLA